MELGLKNKNVLITGSTKGVGKATAKVFASEGANVIITGRNAKEALQTAKELQDRYQVKAFAITSSLSEAGAAEVLFTESIKKLGTLDILVNNAAVWLSSNVTDMEKEEFEETMYLNLEVPYLLSRRMVNHLLERNKRGKIVNVVSQAAFHGSTTGHAHYAASKAGLVAFMISQARETAKYGININAVAPGLVRTSMVSQNLKEREDYYVERIPVGRVAQPEEIAWIIAFLASQKADYLTGITVDATGGMLMR